MTIRLPAGVQAFRSGTVEKQRSAVSAERRLEPQSKSRTGGATEYVSRSQVRTLRIRPDRRGRVNCGVLQGLSEAFLCRSTRIDDLDLPVAMEGEIDRALP